jgi:hypothetical protein
MATKKPAYLKQKTTKDQAIAVAQSWLRASAAAVLAMYMAGITDPKVLANAFAAGLIGPVVKALQSNEKDFGRGSGGGKSHQVA